MKLVKAIILVERDLTGFYIINVKGYRLLKDNTFEMLGVARGTNIKIHEDEIEEKGDLKMGQIINVISHKFKEKV